MCRSSKHQKMVKDKARELGYEYISKNKHMKFRHRDTGKTVSVSGAPKCQHATEHAIRDLENKAC